MTVLLSRHVGTLPGAARVAARWARPLAVLALATQAAHVLSWLVAGALEPGYSHVRQGISELAARDAAHPWVAGSGLVLGGLGVVALGAALWAVLPAGFARIVAVTLFGLAGAAFALGGVLPLDCGLSEARCRDAFDAGRLSATHDAHLWVGLIFEVAIVLTPFAVARALRPSPLRLLALGAGVFGIAFGLVLNGLLWGGGGDAAGLGQRLGLAVLEIWLVGVAVGILHATRAAPQAAPPSPLPAREFLREATWIGTGELAIRPVAIWGRFAQRFAARRELCWLTEDTWTIDDRIEFPGGHVEERRRFCRLVAPDHVHVSADDLPGGADIVLSEDGYRVVPFSLLVPIGPLRIAYEAYDSSRFEPDGTYVNTVDLRSLGVPVARLRFHVRRQEAS